MTQTYRSLYVRSGVTGMTALCALSTGRETLVRQVTAGLVMIVVCLTAFGARFSYAITISAAKIEKGIVAVRGTNAAASASITWEGQVVTQANVNGAFRFTTTTLPPSCVGDVGDGSDVVHVVIQYCGPPGEPGPQGSPGPPGPALVVKDSNGAFVGLVSSPYNATVTRTIDGRIFLFDVLPAGVMATLDTLYFVSSDCTGTPLGSLPSSGYSTFLPTRLIIPNGDADHLAAPDAKAHYPTAPPTFVVPQSTAHAGPVGTSYHCNANDFPIADGLCCNSGAESGTSVAPLASFDLSTLGLVPPFHLEGP